MELTVETGDEKWSKSIAFYPEFFFTIWYIIRCILSFGKCFEAVNNFLLTKKKSIISLQLY